MSEVPGLDLHVDWYSFDLRGGWKFRHVNGHLKNVTLREAIDVVFYSANNGAATLMNYVVESDVIWIAPEHRLRNWSVMRIYDARDIIARKMKSTTAPAKGREKIVEEIIGLICKTIAPGAWLSAAGDFGSIHEIAGLIVVGQAYRNPNSLAALMEKLRANGK